MKDDGDEDDDKKGEGSDSDSDTESVDTNKLSPKKRSKILVIFNISRITVPSYFEEDRCE